MTVSGVPEQVFAFSANSDADSEASLAIWPPLHALQMVTAVGNPADQRVVAASPLPFRATPVSRENVPGSPPSRPETPHYTTLRIPGAKLPPAELASLQGLPGKIVQIPTAFSYVFFTCSRAVTLFTDGLYL